MKLFTLDTDHVSLFQREHPQVVSKVGETAPELLAVTIITVEEQLRGRLAQIRNASQKTSPSEILLKAFIELRKAVEFFSHIRILDFDSDALIEFRKLQSHKLRVSSQDLRIAAIALAGNHILVTRNRHDFEQIPGLILEDWT